MPLNNCFQGFHLTILGQAASVSPESQQSPTTEPHNRLDLANLQQEQGIDSGAADDSLQLCADPDHVDDDESHNETPQKKLDLANPQQEQGIDSGAADDSLQLCACLI